MLHKFGFDVRLPLAATVFLSAVISVMLAIAPPAAAEPTVSADPAVIVPSNSAQYFAAGTTFPLLLYRQFYDFYGIAIPPNPSQPFSTGIQPTNPVGSPRLNVAQFNYCGIGSGNGRNLFTLNTAPTDPACTFTRSTTGSVVGNPPYPVGTVVFPFPTNTVGVEPLFAGTDQELSSTELSSYIATKKSAAPTRGNPIQVPTVFGAIAVAYNPGNGITSINLSTRDLCGIFDGSITKYSLLSAPSLITGTPISDKISVFIRSDNSGTTNAFTSYLALACPLVTGVPYHITAGMDFFPPNSFIGVDGNPGVANTIAATQGGFGYVEASYTVPFSTLAPNGSPAPLASRVQNPNTGAGTANPTPAFTGPTQAAVRAAVPLTSGTISYIPDPVAFSAGLGNCVLSVSGLPTTPLGIGTGPVLISSTTAYPIISPTYTLAYSKYPTTLERDAIRGLMSGFILINRLVPVIAANDQIAQSLGFVLPPNNLRAQARACINTITSP
jgi:phosphate transport system substrate-binding protein